MQKSWRAVGQFAKDITTANPTVTANRVKLSTRQETCKAIREHAKRLITEKKAEMEKIGTNLEKNKYI